MTQPAITSIAIDLDGTLFTPEHDYDHPRFARMLDACDQHGVRVVIASGRQYLSMATMFDDPTRLAFVGDNGSVIVDRGERVQVSVLEEDVVRRVLALLDDHAEVHAVVSGPDGAWMSRHAPQPMIDFMPSAYENIVLVDSLHDVDGPVGKFALVTDDGQAKRLADELSGRLDGALVPVTTGHQGIDLIQPGRHKAWGLGILMERWGTSFDQMVAFGDSGNDVEMLMAAGSGYAMANAGEAAVKAADHRAPSNAEGGVMQVVEQLLGY